MAKFDPRYTIPREQMKVNERIARMQNDPRRHFLKSLGSSFADTAGKLVFETIKYAGMGGKEEQEAKIQSWTKTPLEVADIKAESAMALKREEISAAETEKESAAATKTLGESIEAFSGKVPWMTAEQVQARKDELMQSIDKSESAAGRSELDVILEGGRRGGLRPAEAGALRARLAAVGDSAQTFKEIFGHLPPGTNWAVGGTKVSRGHRPAQHPDRLPSAKIIDSAYAKMMYARSELTEATKRGHTGKLAELEDALQQAWGEYVTVTSPYGSFAFDNKPPTENQVPARYRTPSQQGASAAEQKKEEWLASPAGVTMSDHFMFDAYIKEKAPNSPVGSNNRLAAAKAFVEQATGMVNEQLAMDLAKGEDDPGYVLALQKVRDTGKVTGDMSLGGGRVIRAGSFLIDQSELAHYARAGKTASVAMFGQGGTTIQHVTPNALEMAMTLARLSKTDPEAAEDLRGYIRDIGNNRLTRQQRQASLGLAQRMISGN